MCIMPAQMASLYTRLRQGNTGCQQHCFHYNIVIQSSRFVTSICRSGLLCCSCEELSLSDAILSMMVSGHGNVVLIAVLVTDGFPSQRASNTECCFHCLKADQTVEQIWGFLMIRYPMTFMWCHHNVLIRALQVSSLIASFMGPTWGPSWTDSPMLSQ